MKRLPALFDEGRGRGIIIVAALAIGQAGAAGIAAFATRDVFAGFYATGTAPPMGSLTLIFIAGLVIAALRVSERTVAEGVGQDYTAALRKALFVQFTRMPAREVSQHRYGALAIRFVGDLTAVRSWISLGVTRLISAAIVLPGALVALVLLNWKLAAAAAIPLLLSVVLMALFAPRLAPLHRRLRGKRARLAVDMSERVPAAPELRLLGRDAREITRLDRNTRSLRQAAVERARASAILRALPDIGAGLAGVLLLGTALRLQASPAEAAGALAALGIVALPLRDLAGIWDRQRAWEVARSKCQAILNAPILTTFTEQSEIPEGPVRVDFEQINAGRLRNFSVTAAPGEKIAVVGGNGAGKSTLLALAAGLEQPESGRIKFNGLDIRAFPPSQRHCAIVYVGPCSPILKGSLRRALTLGIKPRPADRIVEAAARDFGLGAVVDRLGGLAGKLSEGGRNLSSGEVRRIQLTRAKLARPRLLLLDEPDDTLDVAGRELIQRLMGETQATILIATHDLALARRSDMIWYIEMGTLCESGSPDLLLNRDGPAVAFFRPNRVA